ncbi:SLC13 family permease [Helicobacter sp. CLO-3]|uniref:SLC13 family permease n=1 Tax=Helicobacter sp. CLO-3 TaxID=211 RepID=UPI000ADEB6F9|nr:SLC13 family permease [Helicobacter sp. CLO-3]
MNPLSKDLPENAPQEENVSQEESASPKNLAKIESAKPIKPIEPAKPEQESIAQESTKSESKLESIESIESSDAKSQESTAQSANPAKPDSAPDVAPESKQESTTPDPTTKPESASAKPESAPAKPHKRFFGRKRIVDRAADRSARGVRGELQAKIRLKGRLQLLLGLIAAIIIAIIAGAVSMYYFDASLQVGGFVGTLFLLIVLWTNQALPLGIVSLLPIVLFPAFGILDVKSATSNYANPIIFLFLGGFMLATAVEKIGLHRIIAKRFLSLFPPTPKGVITALGVVSVALGSALSNSTVALLLIPVALSISQDSTLKTRFLLAVAFGASISGITTPIGTPPNLIFIGFLETAGFESIGFVTWILMMLPLTLSMLYAMVWLLSRGLESSALEIEVFKDISVSSEHKRLLVMVGALLVLLLLNSPIKPIYSGLGLNENVVLLAFGLLMFVPKIGFLKWEDSKEIPYEINFLFGAGFCIAMAVLELQLGDAFKPIFEYFGTLPLLVFIICVCFLVLFLTMFISSTALIAILLSIIYASTKSFLDPQMQSLVMLVATICVGFSFMFPISTPPNAIVFSKGGVKIWDMFRFGALLSMIGVGLLLVFSMLYWRWFL